MTETTTMPLAMTEELNMEYAMNNCYLLFDPQKK